MPDLSSSWDEVKNKVSAIKTYNDLSKETKLLEKNKGDNLQQGVAGLASQLNKIKDKQKRFERNTPTSMDQLIDLIGGTRGNSSETFKYLRRIFFMAVAKMEPVAKKIVTDQTIKLLGCSQEQTYPAIKTPDNDPFGFINSLPVSSGIYIPVKSIDFLENLKIDPNSSIGKMYYEKQVPSFDTSFKPYGGNLNYPFNKMLNGRMVTNNVDRNYSQEFSAFYNGRSEQKIMDLQYTKKNDLGVSGDFIRVFLLDRDGSNSNIGLNDANQVGQVLKDYYDTIKLVDPITVLGSTMNSITNFVSIKANFSYKRLSNDTKFERILTRILGLCQDSRREIDVSGTAKLAELDGVDDSFFEFSEVELREIDSKINNIQNGIITLESCGEVKLPVNPDQLLNDFADIRENSKTDDEAITAIEKLIDGFNDNPNWGPLIPKGVKLDVEINKKILKELPKAVSSGILSPKVLLPIFVLLAVIEKTGRNKINNVIGNINEAAKIGNEAYKNAGNIANEILQSGNTLGQQVDNIVEDAVDFMKKFKTFVIEVVSSISGEFLKILFDIIKKDILNLINVLIKDIERSQQLKKYTIILRLVQLALIVINLVRDYRKCKSLVEGITNLLNLINQMVGGRNRIPTALLPLTSLLPGSSPERAATNVLETLQKLGVPTGSLPDGTPNLMNQFMSAILKGQDKEESENGTIDAMVIVPPLTGGLLKVFGKKR